MSAGKFGLLKGLGDGVAQTGNMLMVDHLDKMKQERLQSYQTKMQDRQFAREDVTRKEDRANQVEDRDLNQENINRQFGLLLDQFAANRQDAAFAQNMQSENLELSRQQISQAIELGNISIQEATRLNSLYDVIANPELSEDQRKAARTTLQDIKNADPERFTFLRLSDEFGPDRVVRASSRTGAAEYVDLNQSSDSEFDEFPDPSSYSGQTIEESETGKRFRSNGTTWVEI